MSAVSRKGSDVARLGSKYLRDPAPHPTPGHTSCETLKDYTAR